jgi:hypothetical protein
MKIVINRDFGGYGLSDQAVREYGKRKGLNLVEDGPDDHGFTYFYVNEIDENNYFSDREIERDDPVLVEIVERLGSEANGRYSDLKIVEIPDDVDWDIMEYDGMEHIAEKHRTWR